MLSDIKQRQNIARSLTPNNLVIYYLNFLTGNVELRIAAGEAVVVLYEAAYDHDEEEIVDLVEPLIPGLQVTFKISWIYCIHVIYDIGMQNNSKLV